MINGLGVVGWGGVGGIEAGRACSASRDYAAAASGRLQLIGKLPEGATATDLVLTSPDCSARRASSASCRILRRRLELAQHRRSRTIANMAPEYGATIGVFSGIDSAALDYLRMTKPPRGFDQARRDLRQGTKACSV